jgi:hypothetical protein
MSVKYETARPSAIEAVTRRCPSVLVAIEKECDAAGIVEVAAEIAWGLGATVTLLRVVQPPPKPWVWMSDGLLPGGGASYFESLDVQGGLDLLEELALAVEQLERRTMIELRKFEGAFEGLAVSRAVAIDAIAGRAIVAWLRRRPHDLVVLATGGRHPLLRLFGPTTLDQVVRSGLASVVVAPELREPASAQSAQQIAEREGHYLNQQRSKLRA